jgi:hypothetical protein
MGLYVLGAVFWILGMRGHIPRFEDYRPHPAGPTPAGGGLFRPLIILVVAAASVAFAVWAAVWLAIHLL